MFSNHNHCYLFYIICTCIKNNKKKKLNKNDREICVCVRPPPPEGYMQDTAVCITARLLVTPIIHVPALPNNRTISVSHNQFGFSWFHCVYYKPNNTQSKDTIHLNNKHIDAQKRQQLIMKKLSKNMNVIV